MTPRELHRGDDDEEEELRGMPSTRDNKMLLRLSRGARERAGDSSPRREGMREKLCSEGSESWAVKTLAKSGLKSPENCPLYILYIGESLSRTTRARARFVFIRPRVCRALLSPGMLLFGFVYSFSAGLPMLLSSYLGG